MVLIKSCIHGADCAVAPHQKEDTVFFMHSFDHIKKVYAHYEDSHTSHRVLWSPNHIIKAMVVTCFCCCCFVVVVVVVMLWLLLWHHDQ